MYFVLGIAVGANLGSVVTWLVTNWNRPFNRNGWLDQQDSK